MTEIRCFFMTNVFGYSDILHNHVFAYSNVENAEKIMPKYIIFPFLDSTHACLSIFVVCMLVLLLITFIGNQNHQLIG
jgi:hypothetical protein